MHDKTPLAPALTAPAETSTPARLHCPACQSTQLFQELVTSRSFGPKSSPVSVELLTSQCTACLNTKSTAKQHDENLVRLAARKSAYGQLLMTEEYLHFRKLWGLSKKTAAQIFDISPRMYARYENELSYPRGPLKVLFLVATHSPEALKFLADMAEVALPMWDIRKADEATTRVTFLPPPEGGGFPRLPSP